MRQSARLRPLRRLALGLAVALAAPAARGQDAPPDAPSARERLDRAEAELRSLREQLGPAPPADGAAAPANPPAAERADPSARAPADSGPMFPTIKMSGAFQADVGWFSQSTANRLTVGDAQDGADFRRARLAAAGQLAEHIDYRLQLDFAVLTRPRFTDVYASFTDLGGLDDIRVGQFKQPFGLEALTRFRFNPFLERASMFLFIPFRQIGIG